MYRSSKYDRNSQKVRNICKMFQNIFDSYKELILITTNLCRNDLFPKIQYGMSDRKEMSILSLTFIIWQQ